MIYWGHISLHINFLVRLAINIRVVHPERSIKIVYNLLVKELTEH